VLKEKAKPLVTSVVRTLVNLLHWPDAVDQFVGLKAGTTDDNIFRGRNNTIDLLQTNRDFTVKPMMSLVNLIEDYRDNELIANGLKSIRFCVAVPSIAKRVVNEYTELANKVGTF